jgi:CheY-like chemotaxis protein
MLSFWALLFKSSAMTPDTSKIILVVEDQDDARAALSGLLEAKGYTVACAENGLAALNELKTRKPRLILLDLAMPVMDGYTFMDHARQCHLLEDVIVIVTSAHQPTSMPGAAAVVGKPIRPERLMLLIRQFLDVN